MSGFSGSRFGGVGSSSSTDVSSPVFDATLYGSPIAWYSADDQGTTEGESLTTLTDRSGNGNHATTGTNAVARMAGGLLGKTVMIDGGKFVLPDTVSLNSRSFSVVVVGRIASGPAQQIYTSLGRTGVGTGQLNIFQASGTPRIYFSTGLAYNSTLTLHGDLQVIACTGGASALRLFSGGSTQSTSALANVTFVGGRIAEGYTGGSYLQAEIKHIIIYPTELTTTQISQINAKVSELYSTQDTTTGTLLACVGDSITRGFGVGANVWGRQVAERLGQPVRYVAWGNDGQALSSAVSPDGHYAAGHARKICVVFLGTNDLNVSTNGTTLHGTLNTFCTARQTTGWQVVVVNTLPRSDFSGSKETERLAYNSLIAANWSSYAAAFVDAAGDSRLSTPANTTWYSDGVHPTAAGAAVLAEKVEKAIRSLY